METTIFYYTATGNSLTLARSLARELGNTALVPVARYRQTRAVPGTARVGIVFPIYAWGPPRTVEEFIAKLDLQGVRYVFAIATCGGTAAATLPRLKKALRRKGSDLHAGFIARAPGYMDLGGRQPPIIEIVRRLSGRLFPTAGERLPEIVEAVRNERPGRAERNALPGAALGSFFHEKASPQFAKMDAAYVLAPTCAGCGTCSRVCPRGNVRLENGRPAWHHDCDNCGACATWCPRHAIGFRGAPSVPRRHNQEVVTADMMWASPA
ncbi:MAG TPA: EFR1 family ferrodoxin [Spirochaetia bacterium]|nr:EFR1 family ferrodoxin [Spirochaetia bacterium]